MYFFLYKFIKLTMYEHFGTEINPTLVFVIASVLSESLTLSVHFPYDLIKCRLQSKNYIFKYENLPHAFSKEIKSKGILGLYQGGTPFLATYASFVCLQFTIYESFMAAMKKFYGKEEFERKEMSINFAGGFIAGCVAAAITNPLECITVNKQTTSDFSIRKFIKEEGLYNICTKGIIPRVAYNGLQSIFFFSLVLKVGKMYNVNLADD